MLGIVAKNLALSFTRYYGHLSSFTISEKTNIQPWEKLVTDGPTDRQMDIQMGENNLWTLSAARAS